MLLWVALASARSPWCPAGARPPGAPSGSCCGSLWPGGPRAARPGGPDRGRRLPGRVGAGCDETPAPRSGPGPLPYYPWRSSGSPGTRCWPIRRRARTDRLPRRDLVRRAGGAPRLLALADADHRHVRHRRHPRRLRHRRPAAQRPAEPGADADVAAHQQYAARLVLPTIGFWVLAALTGGLNPRTGPAAGAAVPAGRLRDRGAGPGGPLRRRRRPLAVGTPPDHRY